MRLFFVFAAVFAVAAGAAGPASISGRVYDPSGAVVSGAAVKLTNNGGEAVATTTDHNGMFRAANLAPATYELAAESAGFTPFSRELALRAGESLVVDVVLEIPTRAEQVTVTAKAPAAEGAVETCSRNSREVLEIREVRESSARDVGEALAGLEGLWKIRKGGIANDVVLRGFQQGNINVLMDGLRIYGACPNHMDPAAYHVDFAEIESVNVTKGPFDVTNQGSLGGTINIVSRKPDSGLRLEPGLSAGSFGFANPSLTGSFSAANVYVSAGYSYRRSLPYTDGSGRSVTSYANYARIGAGDPAFDINTGWMRAGIALSPRQSLDFSYTRQEGGRTLYPSLLMDALYDNADRLGANWSARELTGPVKQVRAQAFFSRVKHWMTDELRTSAAGAPLGFSMGTFAGTRSLGGRLEAELTDAVVGVEAYSRGWNATNTMRMSGMYTAQAALPDVRMLVGGLYAQYRHSFGRLHATFGARWDAADTAAQKQAVDTSLYWAYQGTRSLAVTDTNPSGVFWLTYLLPKGVELFGGVASAVRDPDPEERFYAMRRMGFDWVGNPLLKPTRNNEADLGVNLRSRYVSLRPTLFYSSLADFIVIVPQPKGNAVMGIMNTLARSYEGVDARIYGGEVSYSAGFSRSLLMSGGVSYVRGIQYAKPAAGLPGGNIAEMPPLRSRTSLRYGRSRGFAEIEGIVVARQKKVNANLLEAPTAGYGLVGVKTGLHWGQLNFAAGVDNLFNRMYYDYLSYQRDPYRSGVRIPEPGRTLYLNIGLRLVSRERGR